MSGSLIEESKKGWFCGGTNENPSAELLKLGCLQRIAFALEKISNNQFNLLVERDLYRREKAKLERAHRAFSKKLKELEKAKQ